MRIANPIYDVVFHFLMEDMNISKSFISALIGEKVIELEFAPQEYVRFIDEDDEAAEKVRNNTTVLRLDFAAKIKTPAGHKTVMIEMQKAKMPEDIIRFRRYLGKHYGNRNNTYDGDRLKARQIYCIFFLGYDIGIPGIPVLCVDHKIIDLATSQSLDTAGSNEFISALHHRSWIVQINQLKNSRRNRIEKILSIFDQDYRTQDDQIMNINEDEYPEEFHSIIRRLQMAGESPKIRRAMEAEDDYWEGIRRNEREAARANEKADKALKEIKKKNKTIKEKDKVIEAKDKALGEKDRIIEELKNS